MGYRYDEHNAKMAQYPLLKAEVERILTLLQRERIDFLNFPFMQTALDHDPNYLDKISDNISRLKQAGLIRFATADNFSGERTYLAQVNAGCFNSLSINLNFADHGATRSVITQAQEKGLAVITREVFLKGNLFKMGEEIGVTDRNLLARVSLKWNLNVEGVTTALIGAHETDQLHNSLSVLDNLAIQPNEAELLDQLRTSETYQTLSSQRVGRFWGEE